MKNFFCLLLFVTSGIRLTAQNITMPDSAAVVRNHVKSVKVYFANESNDRHVNLYLVYDKQGRLIREGQSETSYYYAYSYDERGRRVTSTQRSAKGEFTQKYTTEYLEKDSIRKVSLYQSYDTTKATHVYFYDNAENKLREEAYSNGKLVHLYILRYDEEGSVIYAYDSTANSVSVRENQKLVKVRSYSAHNELLHNYTYKYGQHGVTEIIDSISPKQLTRHIILYSVNGRVSGAERNGKQLSGNEFRNFQSDFMYVLPPTDETDQDYGLPVPELINEHKLTYDKKGNIIKDELTQKQGSFSQTYVYEYEYEFY